MFRSMCIHNSFRAIPDSGPPAIHPVARLRPGVQGWRQGCRVHAHGSIERGLPRVAWIFDGPPGTWPSLSYPRLTPDVLTHTPLSHRLIVLYTVCIYVHAHIYTLTSIYKTLRSLPADCSGTSRYFSFTGNPFCRCGKSVCLYFQIVSVCVILFI